MPIYECQVRGTEKPRLVKAATAAQARDHIVSAEAISAERMAELVEQGAKLEKAGEPDPADPANYAPGGPLHGKTKPAAVIAAEEEAARKAAEGGGAGGDQDPSASPPAAEGGESGGSGGRRASK